MVESTPGMAIRTTILAAAWLCMSGCEGRGAAAPAEDRPTSSKTEPPAAPRQLDDVQPTPDEDADECGLTPIDLEPPPPDQWAAHRITHEGANEGSRELVARWYEARIYAKPNLASLVIGYARRGQKVAAKSAASGKGCPAGMWYALADGGYACASRGFREVDAKIDDPVEPDLTAPLPFGYAKVIKEGAPKLSRLPDADERQALEDGEFPSDVVASKMDGAYFVTVTDTVEHEGAKYHRTDSGDWVRACDVKLLELPALYGSPLTGAESLPLAFVYGSDAEVQCECGSEWKPCGTARLHARVRIRELEEEGETPSPHVFTLDGRRIERAFTRIVQAVERPRDVGDDERWIHVDLSEQALVAYEGNDPVYATLVSTGTDGGHETPTGLWRVDRKHITTTMSGPDEEKGSYTVGEVPWTMFYDGAFALHGAYWHQGFGNVRSHGCTNVPPVDARWLFMWSGGLAPGWHAASNVQGPWVYITQ